VKQPARTAGIPLGPYRLTRRLATGGMAEIFLARQEGKDGFSRDLVVKRILPNLAADPEFRRMFRDEARLAARLSHPNVVHVYDYGSVVEEGDETFYLAMELVRGVDLRALIVRAAERAHARDEAFAVPPHHAAKIASFVCEALAYAHELAVDGKRVNIVHRDVTPSNVLVSFDGAVKLADFGIAKSVVSGPGGGATEHGVVKGKYSYLSPEQARGEPLDQRSDLFNVGILIFEAVLGQPLFPHGEARAAKQFSARGEIPDRLRIKRLPAPLAEIVERALAPRAQDRFPDALAMRADLESFLRKTEEPSDSVEIGRFVRATFPDAVAEDARGPRAAGTVPKTSAILPSRVGMTQVPNDATIVTGADPDLEAAIVAEPTSALSSMVTIARETTPPVPVVPPRVLSPATTPVIQRRPARPIGMMLGLGIVVVALVAAAVVALDPFGGPPSAPAAPHATLAVAPPATGELRVTTDPMGIAIEVDGELVGSTPLVTTVTAGAPHVVRAVTIDGEQLAEERVTLGASEVRELELATRPPSASLRIASTPAGASVRIDGELLGETPVALDVAARPHHVLVSLGGYAPVEEDVTFAAPGEQAMLSFALRRQASSDHGRSDHARTPEAAPRGTGTLRIATDPWSEVYEGSRRLGTTPLQTELSAGHHVLSLRSPDHAARTTAVDITAGEVTRVRIAL
jgi:serine/threonine protein kinase